MEFEITKQTKDNEAYFTVNWSALKKAERFAVIKAVPSMAGLFELYYMDDKGKLNLFYLGRAWIEGVRNKLRKLVDTTFDHHKQWNETLNTKKCFYRYALTDSYKDLVDVFYFFSQTYYPEESTAEHSGRYDMIYLKEVSPDKIVTI